jgi:hypothetical protein
MINFAVGNAPRRHGGHGEENYYTAEDAEDAEKGRLMIERMNYGFGEGLVIA